MVALSRKVHYGVHVLSVAFALSVPSAVPDAAPPERPSVDPDWPVCADASVPFGYVNDPETGKTTFHAGIDFTSESGLDVRASAPGYVALAERRGRYGLLIELDHGSGVRTRYGALETTLVKPGEYVSGGQIIARVGSTDSSTEPRWRAPRDIDAPPAATSGPHLHFELWVLNVVRNPLNFLCPRVGCSKTQTQRDTKVYRSWPEWPIALSCH